MNNSNVLLRTKLLVPELRRNAIRRQTILDAIDEWDFGKVLLISAPAGYGKTTLAAAWAEEQVGNLGWLTLEESDNDVSTFGQYLEATITGALEYPWIEPIDWESESKPEEALHRLMVSLINTCADEKTEISLVFDNHHLISNNVIQKEIAFLLDHFPPHLRLGLIGRSEPPLPLSHLRATARLIELHATEMALNFSETSAFLRNTLGYTISDDELLFAYQKTEGWITALQLIPIDQLKQRGEQGCQAYFGPAHPLCAYLRDEVISPESQEVQEFLIKTSHLKMFNQELCATLFAESRPAGWTEKMMQVLLEHNLFTYPVEDTPGWYRYHPLFAQVLQGMLGRLYPDEKKDLFLKASDWFERQHMLEESVQQIFLSGENTLIISHLEKVTVEAIQDGRVLDLMQLIRTIDENVIRGSPILCLAYAWDLLNNYDFESCELWLEKATVLSQTSDGEKKIEGFTDIFNGIVKMMEAILLSSHGESDQADRLIDQALDLLPQDNYFSRSFAMLHHAVAHTMAGRMSEALELYQQAIQIAQLSEQWFVQLMARYQLVKTYERYGRLNDAEIELMRSLAIFSRLKGKYTNLECYLYKELAAIHIARNELEDAWEDFQNYLDASPVVKSSPDDISAHIYLAQFHHANHDPGGAKFELHIAQQISELTESFQDDIEVDLATMEIELQRNITETAERWFKRHSEEYLEKLPPNQRVNVELMHARLLLVEGRIHKDEEKFQQSRKELEVLLPILLQKQYIALQIKAYILLAEVYAELGEDEHMLTELGMALLLAEPEEIRQFFLNEGVPMSRMLLSYMAAVKQNKISAEMPSLSFVSDLVFRMTGKVGEAKAPEEMGEMEDVVTAELLTAREVEVLQLVARGRTNGEIARDLYISINTVKRHLNNIFMKLGVTTRIQAMRVARQRGIIKT